jgi:hypothetical protein
MCQVLLIDCTHTKGPLRDVPGTVLTIHCTRTVLVLYSLYTVLKLYSLYTTLIFPHKVGASSKAAGSGKIGRKGIGFKSVFQITDRPVVISPPFQFCFDTTKVWYIAIVLVHTLLMMYAYCTHILYSYSTPTFTHSLLTMHCTVLTIHRTHHTPSTTSLATSSPPGWTPPRITYLRSTTGCYSASSHPHPHLHLHQARVSHVVSHVVYLAVRLALRLAVYLIVPTPVSVPTLLLLVLLQVRVLSSCAQ